MGNKGETQRLNLHKRNRTRLFDPYKTKNVKRSLGKRVAKQPINIFLLS